MGSGKVELRFLCGTHVGAFTGLVDMDMHSPMLREEDEAVWAVGRRNGGLLTCTLEKQ